MAERTTQSWTTVPHFFVSRDVDASALNAARDALVPTIEELARCEADAHRPALSRPSRARCASIRA